MRIRFMLALAVLPIHVGAWAQEQPAPSRFSIKQAEPDTGTSIPRDRVTAQAVIM